ncbi:hypothetical protein C8J57DRAFT_1060504, partial [Mycena rebaudengoi]
MSSTFSTKLGDDFMRIPKLDVSGNNWVIYKDRFLWATDARGLTDHLADDAAAPVDPLAAHHVHAEGEPLVVLTAAQKKEEIEWKKDLKVWTQGEAIVKQQITGTIPDSLFMKIRNKKTALEIWSALANEFQKKSRMVSVDM